MVFSAAGSKLYGGTPDKVDFVGVYSQLAIHVSPGRVFLISNTAETDSGVAVQITNASLSHNVAGLTIRGLIRLSISNSGNAILAGLNTLAIYFATDAAGDGLTLVRTIRLNLRVPAGSSRSIVEPLTHLPNEAPGNYYVFAQIIESGQALAQAASTTPVTVVAGAALTSLSYSVLRNKSVIIRFEIADISNVPLSGTYVASVSYADSTTSATNIANPKIKLLSRPKRPQHVQFSLPAANLGNVSIKTGGSLTVDMAGIFAQTSITT